MRIYKGGAGVEITLENFLDLLEEDALEDVIDMVLTLEETGSIKGDFNGLKAVDLDALKGDFDGDVVFLGTIDLSDFDGDFESLFDIQNIGLENLLDYLVDDPDYFEDISEDDLSNLPGPFSTTGSPFLTKEEMMDNFLCSNEDLKVKRIVRRFRHIDDASL